MTINLGAFRALVSSSLGRGTSLDSEIPTWIKVAVRFIERNYTFQYMRGWRLIEIDADSDNPHVISLAGIQVKKIEAFRLYETDTSIDGRRFTDLNGPLEVKDRITRPTGDPSGYWLDGVSNIILDAIPDEDKSAELHLVLHSDWGTADAFTHWLLDNGFDLLFATTMMYLAVRARDPKMYQFHRTVFDDSLKSFNLAEEELKYGAEQAEMLWTPEGGGILNYDPGRDQ